LNTVAVHARNSGSWQVMRSRYAILLLVVFRTTADGFVILTVGAIVPLSIAAAKRNLGSQTTPGWV